MAVNSGLKDILLVIDVQNGLNSAANFGELVTKINQRIDQYRQAHRPIVFVQHVDEDLPYDSQAWQLATGLHRLPADRVILKYHSDSFFETGLADFLHHRSILAVEVCGLQTEYCIDTVIRVGHDLGFKMAIISGLDSTFDTKDLSADQIIKHHEMIWNGSFAEVMSEPINWV